MGKAKIRNQRKNRIMPPANMMIWGIFGIFLIYSMSFVFIYFDDFGYGSLSYFYTQPDVHGTNYTFSQLISYLQQIYLEWSGRVIFPGFKILMLRENLWIIRIVQSISVLISFIALHHLSARKNSSWATTLFSCSLYGVFSFPMFSVGFYWFSASATYVWPLAFFFSGCVLMRHIENNETMRKPAPIALACFCFFMTGISQEQTAFMLAVFMFVFCVFDYIQSSKIHFYRLAFLISSGIGCGFLLLAPGNFNRFHDDNAKLSLSLFPRIAQNMNTMSEQYLNLRRNIIFIIIFTCFICYIAHSLYKTGKLDKRLYRAVFPLSLFFILMPFLLHLQPAVSRGITVAFFYAYFTLSIYFIMKYLICLRDNYLTAFFIGALSSQMVMLFYSPYIVERMKTIFYFSLFAIFIRTFADMQSIIPKKKLMVCVLIPIVLVSSANLAYITYGYSLNKKDNIYNDQLLRQASQDIKKGNPPESIVLRPMTDGRFASDFPDFVRFWMREFYDIPHSIEVHYPPYW